MSFSVAPMNTGLSQLTSHFRATWTEWVFSSVNSELSFGSLEDIYVMAAEFWTTTAPKSPAPAIAA